MFFSKTSKSVDQWFEVNNELRIYKIAALTLIFILAMMSVLLCFSYKQDPIVILSDKNSRHYYLGKKGGDVPNKEDVEAFLKEFIVFRFTLDPKRVPQVLKELTPLSTPAYLDALSKQLEKEMNGVKDFGDFNQTVANVEVSVSDKQVLAKFDKIVRLKGLAMVIPTEASFQIVKDSFTKWNLMGILVNGVLEHENK